MIVHISKSIPRLALALAWVWAGAATAQSLTLEPLLREVVTQHPEVRQQRSQIEASRYELDAAKWGRFPSFSVGGQSASLSSGSSSGSRSAAQISLQQPVWTGGKITGQIDYAESVLTVNEAVLLEIQQGVMQRSAQAYFDILRFESRLRVIRDNQAEHLNLLEIIRRRVKSEVSPGTDETQALSRLQQVINERIQVELQIASARSSLEQMLGRKSEVQANPGRLSLRGLDEAALLEQARAFSPERRKLLAQTKTIEAEIELAKSRLKPQVFVAVQQRLGNLPTGQDRMTSYLGVELQTGAGLSALSGIQSALAKQDAERERLATSERVLANQIRATWAEVNALNSQLKPVRALLVSAEEVVASYLRQFQVGRRNWLEVLNAQREKFQSYNSLTDIEIPLEVAKFKLLLLAGQINPESLQLLNE